MRVSNNIHNIPCLDEVEFVEEWTEEEKIPVKASPPPKAPEKKPEEGKAEGAEKAEEKPKEAPAPEAPVEQKYETKKRLKKNISQIPFTTLNFGLPPATKKEFFEFENSLMNKDLDILNMKRLRNNLEAYSYEMRNNLDSYGAWEKYLDEDTKKQFIAEINQVVDWIYGEGENAPTQEYQTRLDKFMVIGEPVKQRHFYYSEIDIYFGQLDTIVKGIQTKMEGIAHLTEDQKLVVTKKIEEAQKFMDSVKADRDSKK